MSKNKKNRSANAGPTVTRRLLPWIILALALFVIGLIVAQLNIGDEEPVTVVEEAGPQAVRDILLYFASPDAYTLVAENATINDCDQDEVCLKDTVQALIAGPQGDLTAVLPDRVALLGVTVDDSLVTLDFSKDFIAGHPGGTQSELLTVYALADTLTVNFPHLRQMRILVEGTAIETIKGHVDLRQPIYPDFSFVEEGVAPRGNVDAAPVDRE